MGGSARAWCWKAGARGGGAAAHRHRASRATPAPVSSCCASPRAASAAPIFSCARAISGCAASRSFPAIRSSGASRRSAPASTGWRAGDRAGVAWLAGSDGICDKCRSGRENLCERATFTGWDVDGGYATHTIARADFALRIPDGFDDLAAAPLLCGGVIGYRSLKRSGIEPGGRLGLYGFGASALIALQIARHWGCRIFVATRSAAEQERARALGAEWAGGYGDAPPEPLDAAITFAPSGDVVRAALRAADRGATVAINAIHLDRLPEMPYEELWWERRLASVANFTRADAREFLDLAARIPVRTTFETHPLEDANLALARLSRGEVRGAAVLVP